MHRVLIDNKLNDEFYRKGFVKFPLFSPTQIDELKAFYETVKAPQVATGEAFHTTSNSNDQQLIRKVTGFIKPYFEQELDRYLYNCNLTISNYLVKESTPDSAVSAHEDWTFVDESKYKSFNLWVCLEDANYHTGNMQFVPGSHQFFPSLRVSPGQPRYYDQIQHVIPDYLVDVPTKAGECVMFSHDTIHASRRNYSGKPRVSCVIAGYPSETQLLHYYWQPGTPNDQVEKYKVCIDSFLDLERDGRPKHSEFLGYVQNDFPYMELEEFRKKCRQEVPLGYRLRTKLLNLAIGSGLRK